jgi:hypothetical protein
LQYWYHSGVNKSMVAALADVVEGVKKRACLEPGDMVLDIGCNDGTLLNFYSKEILTVGIDPATNITPDCDIHLRSFFEKTDFGRMRFKVITAIAMFYDLDDPHEFLSKVASLLSADGILVIQMMDLVRMVRTLAWDNICHEHLVYYNLSVLNELLYQHGLKIVDLETNQVNGGSVRIYATHVASRKTNPAEAQIDDIHIWGTEQFMPGFIGGTHNIICQLNNFIARTAAQGQIIDVLGASTKGNTLLQVCGLGPFIRQAAEVNPEKYGLFTVGSNIPIVPQAESLDNPPDYYLVLPWHFIDFFINKFEKYLNQGGAFIVPMPRPVIIDKSGRRDLLRL